MSSRRFFLTTLPAVFRSKKSFNFDGINDYLDFNSILNDVTLLTSGAISKWIKIPADDNTQRTFFSISNNNSAVLTELALIVDFREAAAPFPGNSLTFLSIRDNTNQWVADAGANFLVPHIGNWINIILSHNGTTPTLYVNGVAVALNFQVSLDKTNWFKGILTDATTKSDVCSIGTLQRNGLLLTPYNNNIDETVIYNDSITVPEAQEIYNNGKPTDPSKLLSSSKVISWLTMGDDSLDDATSGTGVIKDQVASNDAIPTNTAGNNIELDVP